MSAVLRVPLGAPVGAPLPAASDWVAFPRIESLRNRSQSVSFVVPASNEQDSFDWLHSFVSTDKDKVATALGLSGQAYYDQLQFVAKRLDEDVRQLGQLFLLKRKVLDGELVNKLRSIRSTLSEQLARVEGFIGKRFWDAIPRQEAEQIWEIRNAAGSRIEKGSATYQALRSVLPGGADLPKAIYDISKRKSSLLSSASKWVVAVEISAAAALLLRARSDKETRDALVSLTSQGISLAASQVIRAAAGTAVARAALIVAFPVLAGSVGGFLAGIAVSVAVGLAIESGAQIVAKLIWNANEPVSLPKP